MFNTNVHTASSAATLELASDDLEELASQTGFIRRKTRGFSASGFLLSCLKAVGTGKASYRQLAVTLGQSQPKSLCRQALAYRSNPQAVGFLELVMGRLAGKLSSTLTAKCFKRVLVEDSTQMRIHHSNVSSFRGVSNNSGPTSAAKIDVIEELGTGALLEAELTEGHVQDRSLGPRLLGMVSEGDLVLRDMGYFDVKAFEEIDRRGAHWISRLHGQAGVSLSNGKPLEKLLRSTELDRIDIDEVHVTANGYRCRLVATRCPEQVASRRRAVKKHKRKLNGTNPGKRSLIREGWTIHLTNLTSDQWTGEQVEEIYSQRWGIEIRFRALKGNTNMRKALNRSTNARHLRILLLSAMIQAVLTSLLHQKMMRQNFRRASSATIELVANWLSQSLQAMRCVEEPIAYDPRHLVPDRRKRTSRAEKLMGLF